MTDTTADGRGVLQDLGAERAILGAILLDAQSLYRARDEGLKPDDFSQPGHRILYECLDALAGRDGGVDLVTATGALERRGLLEAAGGLAYVANLGAAVPSVANLPRYVRAVRERSLQRRLLELSQGLREGVLGGQLGPREALEETERRIFELRQDGGGAHLLPISQVARAVYEQLEERARNPAAVTGVPTGFHDLDQILAGLQKGDLVVLAARPAMGKTAFSLNILAHAALRCGVRSAYFSLEMPKEQIVARLLASEARVSGGRVRTGHLREGDWAPLIAALERLDRAPVWIDDSSAITLGDLRSRCRRLASEAPLGLVVVDYLQLMRSDYREQSREQEISSISRGLKGLAKELSVPVVALSQLNRGVEQRSDKRPLMSDLRESGAIEQDADVIAFLYRDEVYHPEKPENKGLAEVLVRKQRNGAIGDVKLYFQDEFARFENLERGGMHG